MVAKVATPSKTPNWHKLIQIIAGCELKNAQNNSARSRKMRSKKEGGQ